MLKLRLLKEGRKGLGVAVYFWSFERSMKDFDRGHARRYLCGKAVKDNGQVAFFKDAGELLGILGRWQEARFRSLERGMR